MTIAKRRAIDRLRRASTLERKMPLLYSADEEDEPEMEDLRQMTA